MSTYIEDLEWRYATKKFDNTKKINSEDLDKILKSIQLSASSYGMQPYKVIVIDDPQIKEKLKPAAWGQPQITDSSHLVVFANYKTIDEKYVDSYIENISQIRHIAVDNLAGLKDKLINSITKLPAEDQNTWAQKQAYLALGNLLSAAASYKIDTCPMEGFDAAKFDEILGLQEKGMTTAVIATLGHRSEEDPAQDAKKVRKSEEQLFEFI
ncbi:NAD(P)H-dependent oxidoreductase [Salegentibacter sp. F188]|uniref:NAD(P)H-dependent oxidoreductase n=1 Tax=Autumnicola patrickiae TaxID=3075591 RepID=A0ABU3DYP0_9FLAO|nr:NAD(P)H-dependent oxidoreductase [Salegentibacter sp. F188]MDT0688850.1 NAD(P)H-dependent oxidoreductase [Salegentibacter sp. F188]